MAEYERRISYGGVEATFPDTWTEEYLRWSSHGTEYGVFHSLYPHPNTTIPLFPEFDPSSQFGRIAENSSMYQYELQDFSDVPIPHLWSPLQSDASASSLPSLVASELNEPPLRLFQLQNHELQPQIDQVVNYLPFHPVLEAGLQMEMEFPSNQSHHDIMNTLLRAYQQIMMEQIVGMNHLPSCQLDVARSQTVIIISESAQISCSNCGAVMINESQGEGENTDCSIHGVLSNHPTGKRIRTSEEDFTNPFDGSAFSSACLPPVCSSALPIQQVPEISVAKKQKTETGGNEASATPPTPLPFYNFMKLPHDAYVAERDSYVAERDAIANRFSNSWGDYDVDVELKL